MQWFVKVCFVSKQITCTYRAFHTKLEGSGKVAVRLLRDYCETAVRHLRDSCEDRFKICARIMKIELRIQHYHRQTE